MLRGCCGCSEPLYRSVFILLCLLEEHRMFSSSSGNSSGDIYASKLAPAADVAVGCFILLIVIVSVLGNGVVLLISYRRRKKISGSELLCINLAVVDFLCCVCFYPLSILSSFSHTWLGRQATCVFYGLGCYIFGLCGMLTIAAISITRYVKSCNAVWLEGSSIRLICVAIWVISVVWSSFPLVGWGDYVPEPYGISCTVAWRRYHTSMTDAAYVILSFFSFVLVPVLLIVATQCRILLKINRFSRSLAARGVHSNIRHAEKHLSLMFFCISSGFIIAWAPYTIVSFLFMFHKDGWYMAPEGFVFPALFAKSSHIYNPFIYFYFNKAFREEMQRLVCALCPRLAHNRVGVYTDNDVHPIQIQLQEQVEVRGAAGGPNVRSEKSPGLYSHMVCWVSRIQQTPTNEEQRADRHFLPTSN